MTEQATPPGCRWCGVDQKEHMQRWKPGPGWHTWVPPTQDQIKGRMLARRKALFNEAHPPITEWELEQLTPDGWLRIGDPTDLYDQAVARKTEAEAAHPGTEYRLVDKTTTWTTAASA